VTKAELREEIGALAVDGRVPCRLLLELAGRAGQPPRNIGALCDEMQIKIVACQLGCFR
jgi:hypothetical protein